jgi:sterol-4alpha-carboxylate 3-dehydrogenase (decarboxylating)
MSRTILITGGQGFVGRALVNRFADQGHRVVCADIAAQAFRRDVQFVKLDIRDRNALIRACSGVDSIIHNASLVHTRHNREEDVWNVNLGGTDNVIEACRANGVPRLVYISSASAVYEGHDIENGDESLPYSSVSQAPYADSKIAAEKNVLAFNGAAHTRTCAIRPHVIFGAGDNRFIPTIVKKAREGKLSRAIGNRDKLSDFTYITNLVDAVVAAEERLTPGGAACGQAYFITNGEPMAFFDFVEKLLMEIGYPPLKGKIPYWLAYGVAAIAETIDTLRGGTLNAEDGLSRFSVRYMVTHHYFSIEKARRELQWRPAVSLADGIRATVNELGLRMNGPRQAA